eukprot:SAG11_NODE_7073_length_1198_cov_1.622384_2_plen_71_part_00
MERICLNQKKTNLLLLLHATSLFTFEQMDMQWVDKAPGVPVDTRRWSLTFGATMSLMHGSHQDTFWPSAG